MHLDRSPLAYRRVKGDRNNDPGTVPLTQSGPALDVSVAAPNCDTQAAPDPTLPTAQHREEASVLWREGLPPDAVGPRSADRRLADAATREHLGDAGVGGGRLR